MMKHHFLKLFRNDPYTHKNTLYTGLSVVVVFNLIINLIIQSLQFFQLLLVCIV